MVPNVVAGTTGDDSGKTGGDENGTGMTLARRGVDGMGLWLTSFFQPMSVSIGASMLSRGAVKGWRAVVVRRDEMAGCGGAE